MEFSDWLRKQLERRDMNQKGLAHLLDVRRSTVSMWVNGKSTPRDGHIETLAEMFNANKYELYLMLGRIDPNPEIDPEIEMIARRIGEAPEPIREKLIQLFIAMLDAEDI